MPPETKETNKKGLIIAVAVLLVLAAAGVAVYFVLKWKKQEAPPEDIVKKQMEELDKLRNPAYSYPTTTAELNKQIKVLDGLSSESKQLTQEEINKQLEDLNKLRSLPAI